MRVPQRLLEGVSKGVYYVKGSLIRDANTHKIMGHLEEVPGSKLALSRIGASEVGALALISPQITTLAGLAVIMASLAIIKMQLNSVQKGIKHIQETLLMDKLAKLEASLADLKTVDAIAENDKMDFLNTARFSLAKLAREFAMEYDRAPSKEVKMYFLKLYLISVIAHAYAYNYLGYEDIFIRQITEAKSGWELLAKDFLNNVIGDDPGKYIGSMYSRHIRLSQLVEILRFINDYDGNEYSDLDVLERHRPRGGRKVELPKALNPGRKRNDELAFPAINEILQQKATLDGYIDFRRWASTNGILIEINDVLKEVSALPEEDGGKVIVVLKREYAEALL